MASSAARDSNVASISILTCAASPGSAVHSDDSGPGRCRAAEAVAAAVLLDACDWDLRSGSHAGTVHLFWAGCVTILCVQPNTSQAPVFATMTIADRAWARDIHSRPGDHCNVRTADARPDRGRNICRASTPSGAASSFPHRPSCSGRSTPPPLLTCCPHAGTMLRPRNSSFTAQLSPQPSGGPAGLGRRATTQWLWHASSSTARTRESIRSLSRHAPLTTSHLATSHIISCRLLIHDTFAPAMHPSAAC